MKKRIFAMITLSALALTACGDDNAYTVQDTPPALGLAEQDGTPDIYNEGAELYNEVYLWTEQDSYLPDTEKICVTISNNTDEEFALDERFALCRVWENGVQEEVPYKAGGDCFNELAMLVMPHDSATFIANIAAHYELPLAEGDYLIDIGGMQTGFSVSADAQAVPPDVNLISVKTEFDTYPADITAIRLLITNDGDELFTCTEDALGLEHFGDGFVSMTPFAGESPKRNIFAEAHSTGEWIINLADFGETPLPAGDYAIYLNGAEARFTVTDAADAHTADNSALPEIVFLGIKQYPAPAEADAETVFVTREGAIYLGNRLPLIDLLAAYEAQTLPESFARCGTVDAAELAAQYGQLTKAAESAEIEIVRPEIRCTVMAREYLWYGIVPDETGAPALLQIGEKFHVSQYLTENETVDAVCEWVMSQMDAWLRGTP